MKKQALNLRFCLDCKQVLNGRSDKKFCDDQCRINYHNGINQEQNRIFRKTHSILIKNWKILKETSDSGKVVILKEDLLNSGFNFKYSTHQDREETKTAFYCYNMGYEEMNSEKIRIIHLTQSR